MSEYTLSCSGCHAGRNKAGETFRCSRCRAAAALLEDVLKSREGRLWVHSMLMHAEIAAGCSQSCSYVVPTPGMTPVVNPQSLDESDRFPT